MNEPIFLQSTLLDPRYRLLLNPVQAEAAKREILLSHKDASGSSNSEHSTSSPEQETEEREGEPPAKQFYHPSKLIEERSKEGKKKRKKKAHLVRNNWISTSLVFTRFQRTRTH